MAARGRMCGTEDRVKRGGIDQLYGPWCGQALPELVLARPLAGGVKTMTPAAASALSFIAAELVDMSENGLVA